MFRYAFEFERFASANRGAGSDLLTNRTDLLKNPTLF
jgi:hypothetical protein